MSATRAEREQELWALAQSPAGMLDLCRLHEEATGSPSGIELQHTTADVGPMIVRILDREVPLNQHRRVAAGSMLAVGGFLVGALVVGAIEWLRRRD